MSDNSRILAVFAVLVIVFAAYLFLNNPPASVSSDPSSSTPSPTAVVLSAGPGQQSLSMGDSTVLASYSRSDDGLTDTISLTNAGTNPLDVAVFTITPKEDAASASELQLSGNYFVLEDDPVTVQTGVLMGSRSSEFSVKKSRASQYGTLQLIVDYNAWKGADLDALTGFVKSLNQKVPALKFDAAQRLSYDLNYDLNDQTVSSLSQRVTNAQALLDRDLKALVDSSAAASEVQTLYSTESSGAVLASVDPLSGLAYFKAPLSQPLFSNLQNAKAGQGLPTAEFRTPDGGPVPGSKVHYDLCGGVLCVLVDLRGANGFKAALGKPFDWSGRIQFQGFDFNDPTQRMDSVALLMDAAPDYALYSSKIVRANNQGQPVFLVNNLPFSVSSYGKNSIRYVGALSTNSPHPLAVESWFNPVWYSVVDGSKLEGNAFPESFSTLDLFVAPSTCLHRLCTCAQIHTGISGGVGATQTPAQTYFEFFDSLQSDLNAKALLQKARIADPSILLLIRGQNLGPSCTLEGQSLPEKTSVLKLMYSLASSRVLYNVAPAPQGAEANGRYIYGPAGLQSSDNYDEALTRFTLQDDYADLLEDRTS